MNGEDECRLLVDVDGIALTGEEKNALHEPAFDEFESIAREGDVGL
jgi:hypothetical protein